MKRFSVVFHESVGGVYEACWQEVHPGPYNGTPPEEEYARVVLLEEQLKPWVSFEEPPACGSSITVEFDLDAGTATVVRKK